MARPRTGGKRLAILGFHSIGHPSPGGWDTWFYIPEAIFVDQLRFLRDRGWNVIDFDTLMEAIARPERFPNRCALLTFDDGYRSMVSVTLPILRAFGFAAVVFVPSDFIGGVNSFEPEGWAPVESICGWDELRALERSGVAIQSHGASHRRFSELTPAEQQDELRRSRAVIEGGLHRPVTLFSYPFGDQGLDHEATELALKQAGYQGACLYDGELNSFDGSAHTRLFRLSRLMMGPDTDLSSMLEGLAE